MKNNYDLIILGSGPAGLQAAIYVSRAGFKTLVLGKKENSRANRAHLITNLLGFGDGIEGFQLLKEGEKQVEKFGAEIITEEAIDIKKSEDGFVVRTSDQDFLGKSILIATGVKNKASGILDEVKFQGKGIAYCVACDGFYFKDKKVGVLGGGDFAASEALELTQYTKDITILSDNDELSINNKLVKELEKNNIKIKQEKIKAFFGETLLQGITTEKDEKIDLEGIFIAKGTPKATDFANKLGLEIKNDYIVADSDGKTNIEGVYAAGDVLGQTLQIGFAIGSAVKAAQSIIPFIKEKEESK